jgi:PEP-CTERM motif
MGFAAASNNTPFASFPQASNAIGVIFHSGGGFWANNTSSASDTSLTWPNGGIPTNSGSWYELVLTIAALGSNNFNQTFTVYNANSSGVVGSQIFNVSTSLSNSIIEGASQVYFYMGAEQTRVGAFDNIQIQAVQSTVPEPSTYALFGLGAVGMLLVMRRKID